MGAYPQPDGCVHCRLIRRRQLRERVHAWLVSPAVCAFAISFVAFLAVALVQGEKPFYYDSHGYWVLSQTFSVDGHFSLLNFENNGLRGYSLPLVLFGVRNAGEALGFNEFHIVMAFNAALFALVGAVLAPALARLTWPQRSWSVARRLVLCGLLLAFWRGYLNFPLSDFPALTAALLAILAVASIDSPYRMLGAGFAAGLAVNMRPAYLLLVPALLALIAWAWIARRRSGATVNWVQAGLCVWLFVLGLAAVSAVQATSNHEHLGTYNPIPGGSELADFQYTVGLELQRYDTYVGDDQATPRMSYEDPHTKEIVAGLGGDVVDGMGGYARIVTEHPLVMGGVFLRHVVNGLDQRYPTPYVEEFDGGGNKLWRTAGFLLVFLALVRLLWPAARRRLAPTNWRYPATLLVAGATVVASAVEARFLLPVFLLAALVAIAPGGWPSPLGEPERGTRRFLVPAALLASLAVYCLVVGAIVSAASDQLTFTA